jgi:hypothetical protein
MLSACAKNSQSFQIDQMNNTMRLVKSQTWSQISTGLRSHINQCVCILTWFFFFIIEKSDTHLYQYDLESYPVNIKYTFKNVTLAEGYTGRHNFWLRTEQKACSRFIMMWI